MKPAVQCWLVVLMTEDPECDCGSSVLEYLNTCGSSTSLSTVLLCRVGVGVGVGVGGLGLSEAYSATVACCANDRGPGV